MKFASLVVVAFLGLSACATTSVTPIGDQSFLLDVCADAECGSTGAASVATRMAAVETLRQGYDRYMVDGISSSDNTLLLPTFDIDRLAGETNSVSLGVDRYGSFDRTLTVRMLRPGNPGYTGAIDARAALGPNWERLVQRGISTCA